MYMCQVGVLSECVGSVSIIDIGRPGRGAIAPEICKIGPKGLVKGDR